jgi:amidohydrolase
LRDLKDKVCEVIDGLRGEIVEISRKIFDHPELKFQEHQASRWLAEALREGGFELQLGVADMETAIKAIHPTVAPGPTVAILAEYDALPGLGHACGHNLIAGAALGACLGLGQLKDELPGRLIFYGTPAEEGGGGKVKMVEAGLFNDVDAAMMFHPSNKTAVDEGSLAITELELEFQGKAAHASSAPEEGINALDALIQTFNGINALRQHIKDGARIHGIITDGGAQPNIVPERAVALFYVRAPENDYRDQLIEKLCRCAEGAALAAGATFSWRKVGHPYKAMRPNRRLGQAFKENLQSLGEPVGKPTGKLGSTDMGDVSQAVPAIHPYIAICAEDVAAHSREFARASGSPRGYEVMIKAAKAMAMTAIDLFSDEGLFQEIEEEFQGG